MRILLQNFATGRYLIALGKWTPNPDGALAFPDAVQATAFQIRHRLANTFVVVLPRMLKRAISPG